LCREARVGEVIVNVSPLAQSAIIEELEVVGDDERHDVTGQTLLEHEQSPHSTVAVLERMDALESYVEVENLLQRFLLIVVIIADESLHLPVNLFGLTSVLSPNLVG
jgi:hypothetical protein